MSHAGDPRAWKSLTKILVTPKFGLVAIQITFILPDFSFALVLAMLNFDLVHEGYEPNNPNVRFGKF